MRLFSKLINQNNFIFIILIFLILNNTNGLKNDDAKEIDEILDTLSENINNNLNQEQISGDDTIKSKKPSLLIKKNQETPSTSIKISQTTAQTVVNLNKNDLSQASSHDGENSSQWAMFFILCILGVSILLIHVLIETNFHYLPESVAVVFLGALIGLIFKILSQWKIADWSVSIT